MMSLLEGGEQLERELAPIHAREPFAAPAAGSFLLHGGLAACLLLYGVLGGFLHHNVWGSPGGGGAIQVSLVSTALPLPADQPPNKNVLATDTPSQAPAEPTPKAKQAVDLSAIPISGKQVKPQQQTAPKTQQRQPQLNQDNRAQFGEQAGSSMPHATQPESSSSGPTSITVGDFGSRFGWYVDGINRKMATSWYKAEVDPRTPRGARVYLTFTITRGGNPSDVEIDRSSGSTTLDRSCQRGVQRVDTFGNLPAAYNSSTLKVSYYCEY
jgi:protein TonB